MSNGIIARIDGLRRVDYQGERVITLAMMDELHERPRGTAGRNFRKHRDKMQEGKHFFEVSFETWKTLPLDEFRRAVQTGQRNDCILLTQAGYLLLVKSFRDDLAWQVQDLLVEHYFRSTQQLPSNHLIGYEIARGIREGLELGLKPIHTEIETVKTEMVNGFNAVNSRIDSLERRRDLTSATKQQHIQTVSAYFGGKCPCCQNATVLDAGQNRINAHYDHWFAKGRNRAHETWLVCDTCNQSLLNHEFRDRHKTAFEYYQMRREQRHFPLIDWGA